MRRRLTPVPAADMTAAERALRFRRLVRKDFQRLPILSEIFKKSELTAGRRPFAGY
jgi:hypothetical protein